MYFQRLEDLRIDSDQTQMDIAKYLGCQREVYRRYEKGTRQIPVDMLIQLAKLYNVSIDYIVGLTNEKRPYPRIKKAKIL
ncbi:MAG TPA: helix-turn-helix transcriptional regulator [Candidatus Scybalocola faecavium]|nr:helix-turn-helix transcriptional regulator [Candidatus Scybalocola faecavium]